MKREFEGKEVKKEMENRDSSIVLAQEIDALFASLRARYGEELLMSEAEFQYITSEAKETIETIKVMGLDGFGNDLVRHSLLRGLACVIKALNDD